MNVLICNERLLFRFGVDRALIILGQGLAARGHRVAVMANRFDRVVAESFAASVITVPEGRDGYLNLNEFTAEWIAGHWSALFRSEDRPDVAVIGGWPFFAAIPVFERLGCATVFVDCGAVPLDGFDAGARVVQEKVRDLRRRYLPGVSRIAPISRFIADTQSVPDGAGVAVTPILLGADHMAMGIWAGGTVSTDPRRDRVPDALEATVDARAVILNLGRWEPGCYKNSEAVYGIADRLLQAGARCVVAILADAQSAAIPDRYREHVLPIGFPDDAELQRWMQAARLGISVSRWEGFNLPLVEMQWLDKPVLALDVGAHREVIMDRWFLCRDETEIAAKALALLAGSAPVSADAAESRRRFRAAFAWERAVDQYESMLTELAPRARAGRPRLMIDVSNAARDEANSGVVRVTRRLARELQQFCDPLFAVWDDAARVYVFPDDREYELLSAFNGPVIADDAKRSPQGAREPVLGGAQPAARAPDWLLLTETVLETRGKPLRAFARAQGLRIAAIFYDAIPVLRPDLVQDREIRDNHASYMAGLGECDLVVPISGFSADCLTRFWAERGVAAPTVATVLLPGEFGGAARHRDAGGRVGDVVSILCVSTLEPRKNHAGLLDAMKLLSQRRPDIRWSLTLVGNRYAGGDDIVRRVTDECGRDARIRWLGIVDDAELHRAYRDCSFTVYPSVIEGFGMPILESLWHGKPCLCHSDGVMRELASGGGCLTADVTDADALAGAVELLATDDGLRARLTAGAVGRPIKTWSAYADEFLQAIAGAGAAARDAAAPPAPAANRIDRVPSLADLLYPGCLAGDWQMNDSERLAMTAVLHRLKPVCAIEVGTYRGGSLSLLSQCAGAVFSIDIDPSVPAKFAQFGNVSFFTGTSSDLLPVLLEELDAADLPPEFVLIDGDHSAAGIRRDIEIMLDYVPTKPLVMLLHDGFNPECRRGMLTAEWSRSPYVHWVDVDFVPGRVVEHGGGGDGQMWGGLALAWLGPARRRGPLAVRASAGRTFAEMHERHCAQPRGQSDD